MPADLSDAGLQELGDALPPGVVLTDPAGLEKYRFDWSKDAGAGTPRASRLGLPALLAAVGAAGAGIILPPLDNDRTWIVRAVGAAAAMP